MCGWYEVLRKGKRSWTVGFGLGGDWGCTGRLQYCPDTRRLVLLKLPQGTEDSPELGNFIRILEGMLQRDDVPHQKSCVEYRSLVAEDGYEWMMRQVYA